MILPYFSFMFIVSRQMLPAKLVMIIDEKIGGNQPLN
jgi:hypothetical protein